MKKTLIGIAVICAQILQLHGQGFIIPNGIQYVGFNGFGYLISVLQNPTNGNGTVFSLNPQGKTPPTSLHTNTFSFDYAVDEGVRVFLVSSNQAVSQQTIQSGSYTELMFQNSYIFNNNSPFYVGLYTGETLPQNGIYNDPLFGWARLRNNQGVIELLGGALAYQSQGIFAGTQTLIPEPSALSLIGLGGLLLGFRHSRGACSVASVNSILESISEAKASVASRAELMDSRMRPRW